MGTGRAWPLVGRDEELQLAAETLAQGRGILLAGRPGIGKTRLAREIAAADPTRTWQTAVATTGTADVPLGVFAHLLPDQDLRGGDQAATWRQLTSALGLGAATRAGLLVDDAQWLDSLSAGFVHHLAATGQAALIVTVRAGEPSPQPVAALWKDELVPRLELQPLSDREVDRLLEAVLGAPIEPRSAARFSDRSAGNVLLLRELVSGAQEAGTLQLVHGAWVEMSPSSTTPRLVELLQDRFVNLAPAAKEAAELLALAGPLPWSVVDRLIEADVLATLDRAAVLDARQGPTATLGHPLFGEVLLDGVGDGRRRQLRTRLADAFADVVPDPDPLTAMRIAIWQIDAYQIIDPERALAAADTALGVTASAAAERLARATDGSRAQLRLGEALALQQRTEDAIEALSQVVLADLSPDEVVRYAIAQSKVLSGVGGRLDDAVTVLGDVMSYLGADPHRRQVEARLADMLVDHGRFAAGNEIAVRLLGEAEAEPENDDLTILRCLVPVTVAMTVAGRCRDALDLCARIEPLAFNHLTELPEALGWVFARRLHGLETSGDLPGCEQLISLLDSLPLTETDPTVAAGNLLARGLLTSHRGQLRDSLRLISQAAALHQVDDRRGTLAWCLAVQARLHAQLGEAEMARASIDRAWALVWPDGQVFDTDVHVGEAWARQVAGDLSGAQEQLRGIMQNASNQGLWQLEGYARHEAIRMGADAAHHADRMAALAERGQSRWDGAWSAHARGLAQADGHVIADAAEQFEAMGLHLLGAEAWANAERAYMTAGLRARASQAAQRRGRLEETLQGARTPMLRAGTDTVTLTRRELEIATRAARGEANADIAAGLDLSVRTVETHLQRVFTKLGVNRRAELAGVLLPRLPPQDLQP